MTINPSVRIDELWAGEAPSPAEGASALLEGSRDEAVVGAGASLATGCRDDASEPPVTSAHQCAAAVSSSIQDAWPIGGLRCDQTPTHSHRNGARGRAKAPEQGGGGHRSKCAPPSKKAARKLAVQQTRVQRAFGSAVDPEDVADTIRWLRDGSLASPARVFLTGRRGAKAAARWVRDVAGRLEIAVSANAVQQQAKGQWLQLSLLSAPRPLSPREDTQLRLLVRAAGSGATCSRDVLSTPDRAALGRAKHSRPGTAQCCADAVPLLFVAGEVLGSNPMARSDVDPEGETAPAAEQAPPCRALADASTGGLCLASLHIATNSNAEPPVAVTAHDPPKPAESPPHGALGCYNAVSHSNASSAERSPTAAQPVSSACGPLFELEVPGFALGQETRERSALSPKMKV